MKKGQALVELALILPIVLILLLGITEFGRIYASYLGVVHATREGTRAASLRNSDSEVLTRVKEAGPTLDQDRLTIAITPPEPPGGRSSGSSVSVETSYTVPIIVPLFHSLIGDFFTVRYKTVMRVE